MQTLLYKLYYRCGTGNVPVHASDYKHQLTLMHDRVFQQTRSRYTVVNIEQSKGIQLQLHELSAMIDTSIRVCLGYTL